MTPTFKAKTVATEISAYEQAIAFVDETEAWLNRLAAAAATAEIPFDEIREIECMLHYSYGE